MKRSQRFLAGLLGTILLLGCTAQATIIDSGTDTEKIQIIGQIETLAPTAEPESVVSEATNAVTVTPEMFGMLITHPSTDVSMRGFDAAWRAAFGDRQVTDFLP